MRLADTVISLVAFGSLGLKQSRTFIFYCESVLACCMQEGHAVRSHDAPEFQKGGRRPLAAAAEQEAAQQGDSQALNGMHKTEL